MNLKKMRKRCGCMPQCKECKKLYKASWDRRNREYTTIYKQLYRERKRMEAEE